MAVTHQKATEIFENHPMRFNKKEKVALRAALRAELNRFGYADSEIQEVDASGVNLLVGDPHAEYMLTAHYDTPGRTGWMFGTSRWLGQTGANIFLIVAALLLVFLAPEVLHSVFSNSDWVFWGVEGCFLLMLAVMVLAMVIKNRNNRNDNTSGVLSLLAMAERVAADDELRGKCCFVFFDNEEWGLLGSQGFAKHCKKQGIDLKKTKLINFDCVGNGDILTFASTQKTDVCQSLAEAFRGAGQSPVVKHSRMIFLSDHANFPNSVMVSYTKKSLIGLLYLPLIHTSKDVVCEVEQINRLTDDIFDFIKQGKV